MTGPPPSSRDKVAAQRARERAGGGGRLDQLENLVERIEAEVGRDLDEDRPVVVVGLLQRGEDFCQRGFVLQLPEIRRVRRADVDDKKVSEIFQQLKRVPVIGGRIGERRDFGFAEVDADRVAWPGAGVVPVAQPLSHRVRAGIVEAHAVDKRLVLDHAKHSRLRIAWLPALRDATQLAEAKAQRGPHRQRRASLVHAGSEADRVGEFKPE